MTSDRDPNFEGTQTDQGNAQPPGRVELQTSRRLPPDTPSGSGFGTILTSCLLSLVMGGAGAWAYVDYLGPMLKKKQAQQNPSDAQKSESSSADSAARVNELSGKLDELQASVARLPKPTSTQEVESLKDKVALLDEVSRKVDALGLRVNSLPGKVDQDSRKITTLAADVEGMRNEVTSLRNNMHAAAEKPTVKPEKPAVKPEEPKPLSAGDAPREIAPPLSSLLQAGVESFQKKNYDEASEVFVGLTKSQPDDARVWYYAALSRGLATRDWTGETERLVTRGVDREKAGKPSKAQIDAAFADLTSVTGKDWLAFYRRRAG